MKNTVKNLFRLAQRSHETIYKQLKVVETEIKASGNMVELCDYAYAIDQAHKHIEDLKRELWKLKEHCSVKVCNFYMKEAMQNSKLERSIRTDYVTATPDISQSPNIPSVKSDPAAYRQLMDYLGVPNFGTVKAEEGEEEKVLEPVKPHWPGLVKLIQQNLAAGKPAPPGISVDKLTLVFKLNLRKKKGVLEE